MGLFGLGKEKQAAQSARRLTLINRLADYTLQNLVGSNLTEFPTFPQSISEQDVKNAGIGPIELVRLLAERLMTHQPPIKIETYDTFDPKTSRALAVTRVLLEGSVEYTHDIAPEARTPIWPPADTPGLAPFTGACVPQQTVPGKLGITQVGSPIGVAADPYGLWK